MPQSWLVVANIFGIVILTFGIYFVRHRRRDMVVAFLGINAGVMAICMVLTSVDAAVGLGIGLFGVLSIIRLRSDELDQREVAYYFAALALGLLGGTQVTKPWTSLAMMGVVLATLWFGDHPRLLDRYRVQHLTLDRAWLDENGLTAHLGQLLGADIHRIAIRRVDLVNDTTQVDVRYRVTSGGAPR